MPNYNVNNLTSTVVEFVSNFAQIYLFNVSINIFRVNETASYSPYIVTYTNGKSIWQNWLGQAIQNIHLCLLYY